MATWFAFVRILCCLRLASPFAGGVVPPALPLEAHLRPIEELHEGYGHVDTEIVHREVPRGSAICLVPKAGPHAQGRAGAPFGLRGCLTRQRIEPLTWFVPAGDYSLEWRTTRTSAGGRRRRGAGLKHHLADVTVLPGSRVRVPMLPDGPPLGEIEVTVFQDGRPQAGMIVRAIANWSSNRMVVVHRRIGRTDDQGRVILAAVEPGSWNLIASHGKNQGKLPGPKGLVVRAGQRSTARIDLDLVQHPAQFVAAETGRPLARSWLHVRGMGGLSIHLRTDVHGRLGTPLPAGYLSFSRGGPGVFGRYHQMRPQYTPVHWGKDGADPGRVVIKQ